MAKLIPYTVYLPEEYYEKIREYAQSRKASSVIRDAICMFLSGGDQYNSGYNKALGDAKKAVTSADEVKMLAVNGTPLGDIVEAKISVLENRNAIQK